MKKLIFANCILAIALIFSFCSKPDLKQDLNSVNPELNATDRACNLNIFSATNAQYGVCGTNLNAVACNFCNGASTGAHFLSGSQVLAGIPTPAIISITASGGANVLTLVAGNNLGPIAFAARECKRFSIDNNCNIVLLP